MNTPVSYGISCCEFSPTGTLLAASSTDGNLQIYKSNDLVSIRKIDNIGHINRFAWHSNGYIIMCARKDGSIFLVDIKNNISEVFYDSSEEKQALCVTSSPKIFSISGFSDGTVVLHYKQDSVPIVIPASIFPITSIAIMTEKNAFLTTSTDGIIRMFNTFPLMNSPMRHICYQSFNTGYSGLWQIKLFKKDELAIVLGDNGLIRMKNLANNMEVEKINSDFSSRQYSIFTTPQQHQYIAFLMDGLLKIVDMDSLQSLFEREVHLPQSYAIACHPTMSMIATGGGPGDARILKHNVSFS